MKAWSHHRSSSRLPELFFGELDAAESLELEAHVAECEECAGWLETAGLLSDLGASQGVERHPEAELLARFALDFGSLEGSEEEELSRHVASCSPCRREVEMCRAAAVEAREISFSDPGRREERAAAASPNRQFGRLALAAGLLAATIATGIYWGQQRAGARNQQLVVGQALRGQALIEADESIEAASSRIDPGAEVTLRAKAVVLGDGFAVPEGAKLSIETTSSN